MVQLLRPEYARHIRMHPGLMNKLFKGWEMMREHHRASKRTPPQSNKHNCPTAKKSLTQLDWWASLEIMVSSDESSSKVLKTIWDQ